MTCRCCNKSRCSKTKGATGNTGNTGGTGATGNTGATGAGGSPALLSAFRDSAQTVAAGDDVIFNTLSAPVVGTAFTYSTVTGILTFAEPGDYMVSYGLRMDLTDNPTGATQALLNGNPAGGSLLSFASVGSPVQFLSTTFRVIANAADTLEIQNTGANPIDVAAFPATLYVQKVN